MVSSYRLIVFVVCFLLCCSLSTTESTEFKNAIDNSTTESDEDWLTTTCRLLNETHFEVSLQFASFRFNAAKQQGELLPRGSADVAPSRQFSNEDSCDEGGLLAFEWTSTDEGHCRLEVALNLTFLLGNHLNADEDGPPTERLATPWMLEGAVLAVKVSRSIQSKDEPAKKVAHQEFRCAYNRQVATDDPNESEKTSEQVVRAEEYIVCPTDKWFGNGVELGVATIANRSEWENYDLTCIRVPPNQTVDAATESVTETAEGRTERRKVSGSEPNASTLAVSIAFSLLVVAIVVGYFMVKIRHRKGTVSSYSTMRND